jgi:ankyrin repeat protein
MHVHTLELLSSVSSGDVARVQQLLDCGVPLDAASPGGFTAVDAACMAGQVDVLELLLQHHQQQRQQQQGSSGPRLKPLKELLPNLVAVAAKGGHASVIRSLDSTFDLQQLNLQPWAPLHAAAKGDHAEVVQLLLLQHSSLSVDERSNSDGSTPLHHAVYYGKVQAVQLLLQAGANVHATTSTGGSTALHFAAEAGGVEVAQLLLQAGADVHTRTSNGGSTALHCAASMGRVDVLQLLLDAGADAAAACFQGQRTALHDAIEAGCLESVQLLLRYGAPVDSIMRLKNHYSALEELTPLHMAATYGRLQMLQPLVEAGADLEVWCEYTGTLLHCAAFRGHLNVAARLLQMGARVDATDVEGCTLPAGRVGQTLCTCCWRVAHK